MVLPNIRHKYYVDDDVTFRGTFKIDGVAQTPDAGTLLVTVRQRGNETAIVAGVAGVIAGTQLRYKYTDLIQGQFALFFTADYNSGADQRTGIIEFVVKKKEAK